MVVLLILLLGGYALLESRRAQQNLARELRSGQWLSSVSSKPVAERHLHAGDAGRDRRTAVAG
jgi:hypothetical protein